MLEKGDLLVRDIVYHPECLTTQWEKYVQRRSRKETATAGIVHEATNDHKGNNKDVHKIAAKIHFLLEFKRN